MYSGSTISRGPSPSLRGGKGTSTYPCTRAHNVTDRDLETDRDMERFVEPHTPALSRLSLHTADRRAPTFNMAPTNRAKSDREEAIQHDLEKREQENTPFDDLTLEFGIQKATL